MDFGGDRGEGEEESGEHETIAKCKRRPVCYSRSEQKKKDISYHELQKSKMHY